MPGIIGAQRNGRNKAMHARSPRRSLAAGNRLLGALAGGPVLALALCGPPAAAAPESAQIEDRQLEQSLVLAMTRVAGSWERLYGSDVPIRDYAKHGFLPLKPDRREDYVDFRAFRKPAHLLGASLVTIEEEYQTKFIGCCVNAGVGAVVKSDAGLEKLKRFAAQNACSINEDPKFVAERLSPMHVKMAAGGGYAAISCRERDVPNDLLEPARGPENRTAAVTCVGVLIETPGKTMAQLGEKCRLAAASEALSRVRDACGPHAPCVVEASAAVNPDGPLVIEKVLSAKRLEPEAIR